MSDWRELSKLGEESQEEGAADRYLFHTNLENLLARAHHHKEELHAVTPGVFRLRAAGGYFFTCEFDGMFKDEEGEKQFTLLDEVAFGEVLVHPPINVKDAVAAGRAIAARELKLTEFAGSRVTPPDWQRQNQADAPLDNYHYVTLRTPWHQAA